MSDHRQDSRTSQSSLFIPGNQNFKDNTIEKCIRSDKNKNSQEHNNISGIDSSIEDTFNQTKVHDGNNINLHEDETQHLSVNNDSKEQRNENKNENSQKQNNFSDVDSSIDDKLYPKKVWRHKKLIKKTSHQSLSKEQKSHKKVQKQNKYIFNDISNIDASINDSYNQTKVHDGNNINLREEETQHLSVNNDSKELSGNEEYTNQGGNHYFCKDKKDSDKYELKFNKAPNINTIDLHKDIECKSLNDDEEGLLRDVRNKKPDPVTYNLQC